MPPQGFRDALSIRYKKQLLWTPVTRDGCGVPFNLSHALSCRIAWLVIQRHNEVQDSLGDLSVLAWNQVKREPIVREANPSDQTPALITDLPVWGVWQPQAEVFFDVRVVDTDAQSYVGRSPTEILITGERENKAKYAEVCLERRALFTPLCVSVDGLLGCETSSFIKRLADQLWSKWDMSYSTIVC